MTGYEDVLDQISEIPRSATGRDRTVQWLTTSQIIGAARDHLGRVELFLTGPELKPRTRELRTAIQHHLWHRENGTKLEANRLLFPAFGHYDRIVAFVTSELLREGAEEDLTRAFNVTEPILELAIKRIELSESAMLGLAGELLLLDSLMRRADDQMVGQLVASWDGWRRSARDFLWRDVAIEVKTTTRETSSHIVQGTHQVEPSRPDDDSAVVEERLVLVSIGLKQSIKSVNSFSIPSLVARIIDRLESTGNGGDVTDFLSHVADYGSESGIGYHHRTMATDPTFAVDFTPTFVRGYDMGDAAVQVIRRGDVINHQHVDAHSLSFRIDLPAMISLDNPVDGLYRVADDILGGWEMVYGIQ